VKLNPHEDTSPETSDHHQHKEHMMAGNLQKPMSTLINTQVQRSVTPNHDKSKKMHNRNTIVNSEKREKRKSLKDCFKRKKGR
jgi:hypothetical protein